MLLLDGWQMCCNLHLETDVHDSSSPSNGRTVCASAGLACLASSLAHPCFPFT